MKKPTLRLVALLLVLGFFTETQAAPAFLSSKREVNEHDFKHFIPGSADSAAYSHRINNEKLEAILKRRFNNDRSGVCVAAAYIEKNKVSRAKVCAHEEDEYLIEGNAAFEIGSISKTMTAALLASMITQGKLTLDDSLAMHLPPATVVPTYNGQPILLKHVLTHTSGLPSYPDAFVTAMMDIDNPYAHITPQLLLDALATVSLNSAPGSQWAYSNMGFMLLSYVASDIAQLDLETLLQQRLFHPLKMKHAYIANLPKATYAVLGHMENNRQPTSPWDSYVDLAGAGGVRATLDDMIRYAQANLGKGDATAVANIQQTHALIDLGPDYQQQPMGMAWFYGTINGIPVLFHGGGTGGFSTLIAIDKGHQRAVVILENTATVDGGESVAVHLLDPQIPLPGPRLIATPSQALLEAMQGQYLLNQIPITLSNTGQALSMTVNNEVTFELGYDSYGDFYPFAIEGVLTPTIDAAGNQSFMFRDRDGVFVAQRL